MRRLSIIAGLVLAGAAVPGAAPQAATDADGVSLPEVRREDLARWRALVRPAGDELAYTSIPWIPDFAEGVLAAAAAERPLLLWAMNGHPLACT